jgi:hypothetical protein
MHPHILCGTNLSHFNGVGCILVLYKMVQLVDLINEV